MCCLPRTVPHRVWQHFANSIHRYPFEPCSQGSGSFLNLTAHSLARFFQHDTWRCRCVVHRVLVCSLFNSRVLSVGPSTPSRDMAAHAAPDSKQVKTSFTCCGTAAFDKRRNDPSPSCLHPVRACLRSARMVHCLPTP